MAVMKVTERPWTPPRIPSVEWRFRLEKVTPRCMKADNTDFAADSVWISSSWNRSASRREMRDETLNVVLCSRAREQPVPGDHIRHMCRFRSSISFARDVSSLAETAARIRMDQLEELSHWFGGELRIRMVLHINLGPSLQCFCRKIETWDLVA